jgi:hypothetical protein
MKKRKPLDAVPGSEETSDAEDPPTLPTCVPTCVPVAAKAGSAPSAAFPAAAPLPHANVNATGSADPATPFASAPLPDKGANAAGHGDVKATGAAGPATPFATAPKRRQVEMTSLAAGRILHSADYMRVLSVNVPENKMQVEMLRSGRRGDCWELRAGDAGTLAFDSVGGHFREVRRVKLAELVRRFLGSGSAVFQIVFDPQLTPQGLADNLAALEHPEFTRLLSTAEGRRQVAGRLMHVRERRLTGRLVSPDAALGQSLVDDLEIEPDAGSDAALRTVCHRGLRSLTLAGIKFVLA